MMDQTVEISISIFYFENMKSILCWPIVRTTIREKPRIATFARVKNCGSRIYTVAYTIPWLGGWDTATTQLTSATYRDFIKRALNNLMKLIKLCLRNVSQGDVVLVGPKERSSIEKMNGRMSHHQHCHRKIDDATLAAMCGEERKKKLNHVTRWASKDIARQPATGIVHVVILTVAPPGSIQIIEKLTTFLLTSCCLLRRTRCASHFCGISIRTFRSGFGLSIVGRHHSATAIKPLAATQRTLPHLE